MRPGLALYGIRPWADLSPPPPLRPVLTLKAKVIQRRVLYPGDAIGYGWNHTVKAREKPQPVALLAAGYADGIHRQFSPFHSSSRELFACWWLLAELALGSGA